MISPKIARGILQGEAGITNADSNQPIVGSFGANECVIITAYSGRNKSAGIAHVDAIADPLQALSLLFFQLSKDGADILKVELATEETTDNPTLDQLKAYILEHSNAYILGNIHNESSLAIDARNGNIITPIAPKDMDLGENPESRMEKRDQTARFSFGHRLLIKLQFDGRVTSHSHEQTANPVMTRLGTC